MHERYSRQMLFSPIGEEGQIQLSKSSVLVVGAGALGTVLSNHLVRSGVGKLRIIDRDYVELSNLQRQTLFDEEDVSKALPKAKAAAIKLEKMNSEVEVEAIVGNVTSDNIEEYLTGVDIVLDGTDNFSTRFILNDACFKHNIPFSYGGVVSSRGMSALFIPGKTPCLRCMVNPGAEDGQTCDTVGVISPAVDIAASYQVSETLKYLTGNENALRNTLKSFDIWFNHDYEIKLTDSKPDCPTCQKGEYPSLQHSVNDEETVMCGRDTVQIHKKNNFDLDDWEERLSKISDVQRTPFLLKATIKDNLKLVLFPDGRVLVQGTEDRVAARTWYDRYIGS